MRCKLVGGARAELPDLMWQDRVPDEAGQPPSEITVRLRHRRANAITISSGIVVYYMVPVGVFTFSAIEGDVAVYECADPPTRTDQWERLD